MIGQLDPEYIRARPAKAVTRLLGYALVEGRPVTTSGRWINRLVFAQFGVVKRLPRLKRVEQPIFILGTGRSGSTILGKVMSLHPRVGFLNEPKALWHTVHPGDDIVGNYARMPGRYRLTEADASPRARHVAHRLYGFYLAATGASRVLDKYPEMIFRLPFLRALFPDAKLVFLVRNGWDTSRSIEAWSRHKGQREAEGVHDWWGVDGLKWRLLVEQLVRPDPAFAAVADEVAGFSRHEDMAAAEWVVTMREGLRWMDAGETPPLHVVRYEDLTAYPEATLGRLLDFCELPPDARLLAYARETLEPSPPRPPFELAPGILPLFREAMRRLGYLAEPSR